MKARHALQLLLANAVIVGGWLLAVPNIASALATSQGFAVNQHNLEQQLANRVSQLGRLSEDVSDAKPLTPTHVITLNANIMTATSNIDALVSKVATDTTESELAADRASMLQQNSVFAVLAPQVFQTIEADSIAAQVRTYQTAEASLQSMVNALVGQRGATNAANHYVSFVKLVTLASMDSTNVASTVLAQTPAAFPGDTDVFTEANHELLSADVALAQASYDASIIGLAAGGYSGS